MNRYRPLYKIILEILPVKRSWLLLFCLLFYFNSCKVSSPYDHSGWATYAGSKEGNRYSSNDEINSNNVANLQVAWSYSSNDKDPNNRSQNQCNPIFLNGILYGISPRLKLFALNGATGKQIWLFDPAKDAGRVVEPTALTHVSRGLVYWQDDHGYNRRLFYSAGSRLYAINATDGKRITDFGEDGSIDLKNDLDVENTENMYITGTTPGVIYKDVLIMGMRLPEDASAVPGHIRAFDVRTGKRRWIFHTIPHPGELGYDTWEDKDAWKKIGGANNWAGMALDEKRGIVYVPTGSATPDFYGGVRKGSNFFSNSIIALNAATGKYIWHYQVVHHDMWDRDLPANPNLVTVKHEGKKIDAVAQITKHGYIFLLDRTTGKPVFPIEEIPVPQNALPGEKPWPTQPIPTLPEPFARLKFDPEDITNLTPEKNRQMMEKYKLVKHGAMFTPPGKEGAWIFPGFDGGGEWGGAAVDPKSQILYINSTELPWSLTMMDVPKNNTNDNSLKGVGQAIYNKYCMACHGQELKGNSPSYPSLLNLEQRFNEIQVRQIIDNGRNMMPSFKHIPEGEKNAMLAFLLKIADKEPVGVVQKAIDRRSTPADKKTVSDEVPFVMTGYNRFLDKDGYPGIKPPWGTLNAVDLNSGKLLWKVPLGEYPELTKKGIPVTGTENYGGPLVTKGGLVFVAATKDEKIRAFDKKTGKVLWEASLPAAGYATPATYSIDGKQYVVIACGGGKIGSKSGDSYVAFALPDKK